MADFLRVRNAFDLSDSESEYWKYGCELIRIEDIKKVFLDCGTYKDIYIDYINHSHNHNEARQLHEHFETEAECMGRIREIERIINE